MGLDWIGQNKARNSPFHFTLSCLFVFMPAAVLYLRNHFLAVNACVYMPGEMGAKHVALCFGLGMNLEHLGNPGEEDIFHTSNTHLLGV